jgi:hypothetical protein
MEWLLELSLIVLLALTLFHAIRLERALGVLKRDRAELEALVGEFNASSQAAEQGIAQLRQAVEGSGQSLADQMEVLETRREDLDFLIGRAEALADRLEGAVRAARPLIQERPTSPAVAAPLAAAASARPRSQAEQELMKALRFAQ